MANLADNLGFVDVTQLELVDLVLGGVGGTSNIPLQQLASRDRVLKTSLDGYLDKAGSMHSYVLNGGTSTLAAGRFYLCRLRDSETGTTTLTLPAAATAGSGAVIKVHMLADAYSGSIPSNRYSYLERALVISRSGSNTIKEEIDSAGTTTVTMAPGETIEFVSNGSDTWIASNWSGKDTVKAGSVIWSARSTVIDGYLVCNGAAISRTTYARLFGQIGTVFGVGNGTTTFNVPDLRGEFIRAWDNGRGIDTGRTFGSAQGSTMIQQHLGNVGSQLAITVTSPDSTSSYSTGGQPSGVAGSSQSFSMWGLRPRNIALLPLIKF